MVIAFGPVFERAAAAAVLEAEDSRPDAALGGVEARDVGPEFFGLLVALGLADFVMEARGEGLGGMVGC